MMARFRIEIDAGEIAHEHQEGRYTLAIGDIKKIRVIDNSIGDVGTVVLKVFPPMSDRTFILRGACGDVVSILASLE